FMLEPSGDDAGYVSEDLGGETGHRQDKVIKSFDTESQQVRFLHGDHGSFADPRCNKGGLAYNIPTEIHRGGIRFRAVGTSHLHQTPLQDHKHFTAAVSDLDYDLTGMALHGPPDRNQQVNFLFRQASEDVGHGAIQGGYGQRALDRLSKII